MLVPSAAADRPSRVAAYFQIDVRPAAPDGGQPGELPASASCSRTPVSTSTPAARSVSAPPRGDRVGIGHGDDDPGDAGVDQGLGAGAGATGVVAGFEGDDGGAAAGPLAGLRAARRSRRAGRRRTRGSPRRRACRRRRAARSRRPDWGWSCRDRGRPARSRGASPRRWKGSPCPALSPFARCATRYERRHAAGRGRLAPRRRRRPHGPTTGPDARALSPIRTFWAAVVPRPNRRPWVLTRSTGRRLRPGRGLTGGFLPWITAGSELHRVPPARGGLREPVSHAPAASRQATWVTHRSAGRMPPRSATICSVSVETSLLFVLAAVAVVVAGPVGRRPHRPAGRGAAARSSASATRCCPGPTSAWIPRSC